jgi:tRNA-dependent cyclodipeptide synthase
MTTNHVLKVKNGAGWRKFARVRLQISVGQAYHEGSKLSAVVAWINRNETITSVDISVNDELQAHTLMALGYNADEAQYRAAKAGADYVERNAGILGGLTAPATLTRWWDWLNAPSYQSTKSAFDDAWLRDPQLRSACNIDSRWIVEQRSKQGMPVHDVQHWVAHSTNYVREEMVVFAIQSALGPAAEIYPGRNLATADYFLSAPPVAGLEGLRTRYFTRIDFRRQPFDRVKNGAMAKCDGTHF